MGCLAVAKGVFNLLTGLILAVAGTYVLSGLPRIYAESGATPPTWIAPFVQRPSLLVLVCVPAIVGGVWLIITPRHRWLVMTISTLFLLAGAILVVVAMVEALAPLYSPRPL